MKKTSASSIAVALAAAIVLLAGIMWLLDRRTDREREERARHERLMKSETERKQYEAEHREKMFTRELEAKYKGAEPPKNSPPPQEPPKPQACGECQGNGRILLRVVEGEPVTKLCPTCNGSKVAPTPEPAPKK